MKEYNINTLNTVAESIVNGLDLEVDMGTVTIGTYRDGGKGEGFSTYREDCFGVIHCYVGIREDFGPTAVDKILAHELKHVEQYQTKKLSHPGGKLRLWENTLHTLTDESYYDSPWEVEARRAEVEYTAFRWLRVVFPVYHGFQIIHSALTLIA